MVDDQQPDRRWASGYSIYWWTAKTPHFEINQQSPAEDWRSVKTDTMSQSVYHH